VRTLDGLQYVFNGLGEYWLLESASLAVQARTVLAWNDRLQPTRNGTVLAAVAAAAAASAAPGVTVTSRSASVHVEMPPDRVSGTYTCTTISTSKLTACSSSQSAAPLRELTCDMDHLPSTRLYPSKTVTRRSDPRGMQG